MDCWEHACCKVAATYLNMDTQAVLDNLSMGIRLILVSSLKLATELVHVEANEPIPELKALHIRMCSKVAGRGVVCKAPNDLTTSSCKCLMQMQKTVCRHEHCGLGPGLLGEPHLPALCTADTPRP